MAIAVSLAVAALADIGATLSQTTSSSVRSGRWTCTLNSSRSAFSAAMEGGPMEPPSIPGPVDNTLCGTSSAQIRLPRRTLTSLHWRQGRQHLRNESRKRTKYAELSSGNYAFVPIAMETLWAWGPCALELCADLGGRISRHIGDAWATAFLKQRLDMAIQRGNAAAVVGTLAEGSALQD